jgi:hypothetical protein
MVSMYSQQTNMFKAECYGIKKRMDEGDDGEKAKDKGARMAR